MENYEPKRVSINDVTRKIEKEMKVNASEENSITVIIRLIVIGTLVFILTVFFSWIFSIPKSKEILQMCTNTATMTSTDIATFYKSILDAYNSAFSTGSQGILSIFPAVILGVVGFVA